MREADTLRRHALGDTPDTGGSMNGPGPTCREPATARSPHVLYLAEHGPAGPAPEPPPLEQHRGWRRTALTAGTLAAIWAGLTGLDPASWIFGAPVVAAAAALSLSFPPARAWRISPIGALRFAGWFAVASARGAIDVALRATAWRVRVRPGIRTHVLRLPEGPARLVFVNAITLLPGTLSADLSGARVSVHMLDADADLEAELAPLEARVRALFALPDAPLSQPAEAQP